MPIIAVVGSNKSWGGKGQRFGDGGSHAEEGSGIAEKVDRQPRIDIAFRCATCS